MPQDCVNHAGTAALAACLRCQKGLCRSCAIVTPTGTFCSSECKLAAREPKVKEKGGGMAGKVLVLIVLVIISAQCMLFFAARNAPEGGVLRKLDLIGPLLKRK